AARSGAWSCTRSRTTSASATSVWSRSTATEAADGGASVVGWSSARGVTDANRRRGFPVNRLLSGLAVFVLAAAVLAGTAAARGPAGRDFHGAVFSAGVSGDLRTAAGPTITAATPFLDSLVRVSPDRGVSAPLTAHELPTRGHGTLDSETEPMVSVNQSNRSNVVGIW